MSDQKRHTPLTLSSDSGRAAMQAVMTLTSSRLVSCNPHPTPSPQHQHVSGHILIDAYVNELLYLREPWFMHYMQAGQARLAVVIVDVAAGVVHVSA